MEDAPWMPPPAPGDEPAPPAASRPEAPAPAPVAPAPDAAAWARGGDESGIAPELPAPAAPTAGAGPFDGPPAFSPPPMVGEPIEPTAGGGRSSRSKVLVGAAVVAVLAVGAAGVFAVRGLSDSAEGGAATPDELGTALMTAIENEDVLGMVDVLSPGERDLFRQPMIDLVSELTRLEVLSPEADLAKIEGFDVVLEGESVNVRSTNVADIANVDISADATVSVDGAVLPVGPLVTDNMDADELDEMRNTTETSSESFDFSLTAVEEDGRWYFSLFHTLAETVRGDLDDDTAIPLEGIGSVGAESPEAAVNQLFDSVESLDLELMMQTLNPGEAAALQRYAPLFLDEADDALDEVPLNWEITTREFRVEGDGSRRTVLFDAFAISGDLDGEEFAVSIDGDCVSAEFQGETFEQCAVDATASEQLDELLADAPAVKEFFEAASEAFADVEPIGLELREYEGAWYVSPVSSFSEAFLKVLRALDREEIDRLIDLGEAAFAEGVDGALGGWGEFTGDDFAIEDDFTLDELSGDDIFGGSSDDMSVGDSMGDITFDDSFDDSVGDSFEAAAWDACYSERDPAAAAACFETYLVSGEIEPYMVPIELRYLECGYEERWTSELYSLPDAEFIAAVEASRPCFMALVESGEISEFDLPSEVLHLECFEGRNWFNVFDDPEYDERYYACVEAASAP